MNREKFLALERLGLTSEEAHEWINHLCNKTTFKSPIPLVYKRDNGYFEVLPYLDLGRKEQVYGILTNNVIWPLVGQNINIGYYNAERELHQAEGLRLPTVHDFRQVKLYDVHCLFQFLSKHGIECDLFDPHHAYWTCQTNDGDIVTYSFGHDEAYRVDPTRRTLNARFCMDYYFNDKII